MKIAGLDIGTSKICGLVLDTGTGDVASVATESNPGSIASAGPGEALQDPDRLASIAEAILQQFRRRFPDVRAVGVTGQMHGILYVDAKGKALGPLYTWQDGRGDRELSPGLTYAKHLSGRLGRAVSTGMGFVTHYYNTRAGLVPGDAASLCTAADYVALRLAKARAPVMDASNAAGLGCFDLAVGDFRRSLMAELNVDPAVFPPVSAGYPALGEAAPGVPVYAALGDNQASFMGSVREAHSSVLVNIGTGSQVSIFTKTPADSSLVDARPFPFGGFLAVGAGLCGGRACALLRSFFERTVRLFGGGSGGAGWDVMNGVGEQGLGAERLTIDTRFAGTRHDPLARGSVHNLGAATFTPEHMIAGVREGIAGELMGFYDAFPAEARGQVTSLVGSGNGLRLNPALRLVCERRFGMPMVVPAHAEEAAFGAALLAGVAGGALSDLAAAGRLIRYGA